jgi:hypothetical protein
MLEQLQMQVFELRSRDRFVIRFAHEIASLSSLSCVFVETLEALYTFPVKSGQVVLADFEQQFISAFGRASSFNTTH